MSIRVFAFECSVKGFPPTTINHTTRSKARYEYLLEVRDCWPDITFADIGVRKVGGPHTSEGFKRTATYRGMPELRCGTEVVVNGRVGVIVGHNSSANFDVLFVGGDWGGCVLNCHPCDIQLRKAEPALAACNSSEGKAA